MPTKYKIAEVDAMQLEFRVAAYLGQDKKAMSDILDPDFDAHCRTASIMNDKNYDDFLHDYRAGSKIYAEMRTAAKPDTFKPLYGGTKGTPEQERYYADFRKRYSGIADTQENWLAEVIRTGKLILPWGMQFEWDVYMNRNGVAMNRRTHKPVGPQVFNYPVQNLATAEMVPIAIIALHKRCREAKLDVKFVNTVHDSVICLVATKCLARFELAANRAFTTDVYEALDTFYGIDFNVPLGCEIVIGDNWGTGNKHIHDDVKYWSKKHG